MADMNNTIPGMLGGRVRKRRMSLADLPSKRVKTAADVIPSFSKNVAVAKPASVEEPIAKTAEKSVVKSVVAKGRRKSSRQLRLTELLKRDRQQRLERSAPQPTIVQGAPHMDARRPLHPAVKAMPKSLTDAELSLCTPERPSRDTKSAASQSLPPKYAHVKQSDTPITPVRPMRSRRTEGLESIVTPSSSLASTRIRASGSEAITYSRSMLPASHLILLDILAGIETAVSLLRTRRELTTFGAVKVIVAKNSKRDFTFRHLSQLAHLVPEVLCVLPSRNPRHTGREHLILRLDNVDQPLKSTDGLVNTSFASTIGGSATRSRRRLLHDRLLEHVLEHHKSFLKLKGVTSHESNMWHQDFDLEADVPQLGAPPLYPVVAPKPVPAPAALEHSEAPEIAPAVVIQEVSESEKSDACDENESCIPVSLLERVRARSAVRNATVLAKNQDYRTNPDYLARLPATMDTVASILRNDRRQAFGWSQLIGRLVKMHPRKWPEEELERQLSSITEIADEWCSKVQLSGPKARFAFRVKNEKKFSSQRAKVVSTS